MNQDDFDKALSTWLEGAQAIIDRRFNNAPDRPTLSISKGRRWVKIINTWDKSRSAHAFIDPTNGDVLKAATWYIPAKHARGNIFDESNGLSRMEWTGPEYLR